MILSTYLQLTITNLTKKDADPKVTFTIYLFYLISSSFQGHLMPPNMMVLCITTVGSSHVLLDTNGGQIVVYDAYNRNNHHTLQKLPDSVLCLYHVK